MVEFYVVFSNENNQGNIEWIIGIWINVCKNRDKFVLVIKIIGLFSGLKYI